MFEKVKYVWNTIINSKEVVYIIPVVGIIILTMIISIFVKNKKFKRVYLLIYTLIVGFLFFIYHETIINMLSNLFQLFVNNILFPNIVLYLIIIIIANIVLITTVINNNYHMFIKGVNFMLFSFMQVLLFFIFKDIITNKVDITSKLTMDTNPGLLILVETSIFIFALWCILLLIIKLVNNIKDNKQIVMEIDNIKFLTGNKIELCNRYSLNDTILNQHSEFIEYIPIKKKI